MGYPKGVRIRGLQEICTHQFSPTEQFLFSDVVCKKPLSDAFADGVKR